MDKQFRLEMQEQCNARGLWVVYKCYSAYAKEIVGKFDTKREAEAFARKYILEARKDYDTRSKHTDTTEASTS